MAFVLGGLCDRINFGEIHRIDAVIIDVRTRESEEYPITVTRYNIDGEEFSYELRTRHSENDMQYLQVESLISVYDIDRYPIAHWEYAGYASEV